MVTADVPLLLGNQALNEVHLHRGRHAHLTLIETFVDGQHLTEAIVSGLQLLYRHLLDMVSLCAGRWSDSIDADRFNRLFAISGRTHCTSDSPDTCPYTNMPAKSELQKRTTTERCVHTNAGKSPVLGRSS